MAPYSSAAFSRFCFSIWVSPPISFYRSLQETLRGGRRSAPCVFRRGGFFLEPTGQVLPCWRSSELLFGSVAEDPRSYLAVGYPVSGDRGARSEQFLPHHETLELGPAVAAVPGRDGLRRLPRQLQPGQAAEGTKRTEVGEPHLKHRQPIF